MFLWFRILTLIRFLFDQLLNRRFFWKYFKNRFWLNHTYLTDLVLKIKNFMINSINWLNFLKIKPVNSTWIWSCNWSKQNSLGLHLLVINFLNHALLIVRTREENRILKTERTLFSDETFESLVTEVAVLLFILCEFFNWRLRVVSFVSASALRSLLCLRRIARNLKTFEVTFFTSWDVEISENVTLNWLKGMSSLSVFR